MHVSKVSHYPVLPLISLAAANSHRLLQPENILHLYSPHYRNFRNYNTHDNCNACNFSHQSRSMTRYKHSRCTKRKVYRGDSRPEPLLVPRLGPFQAGLKRAPLPLLKGWQEYLGGLPSCLISQSICRFCPFCRS